QSRRQFKKAIEVHKKAIELDAGYSATYFDLAEDFKFLGMCKESIAPLVKALQLYGQPEEADAVQQGYAKGGCRGAAEYDLKALMKRSQTQYVEPALLAEDYLQLGDKDHAIEWLEKAYREKSNAVADLKVDLRWESLRSDPRFQ